MTFRYDLRHLHNKQQLLDFLGISEVFFDLIVSFEVPMDPPPPSMIVSEIEEISFSPFLQHKIPKKNKGRGYRVVWEPLFFKEVYRKLGRRLSNFFQHSLIDYPHPSAYGYLGGRNIKQNAIPHCGHKFLLSTDIVDFFPSISSEKVHGLFIDLDLVPDVALALSRFVTIGGSLPLGLPTSPVLSNAIFLPTDVELQDLARCAGATYTRYSDDLSFSSKHDLPLFEDIFKSVNKHGFHLAEEKTKLSKIGQAHYVTGLSIADPNGPHVSRDKKRQLRQELYYAQKHGLNDHFKYQEVTDAKARQQNVNRLDGLVKFVSYHEPKQSARLKAQWSKILMSSGSRPSYEPGRQNRPPFCICIDEAEFRTNEGLVLALVMSVSQHQRELDLAAEDILQEWNSDFWAAGNREIIKRRGLHFVDASEDLRLKFISRMQTLPFEGYVSFGRLSSSESYEATYLRLVNSIIKRRLMAAESQLAIFIFEENNKVSNQNVQAAIDLAFDELKSSNNRRPRAIIVEFKSKPDLSISYPDFLLGVLGRYLRSKDEKAGDPTPRDRLLFERLRDKYRLILDADTGMEFSRRREIQPWV